MTSRVLVCPATVVQRNKIAAKHTSRRTTIADAQQLDQQASSGFGPRLRHESRSVWNPSQPVVPFFHLITRRKNFYRRSAGRGDLTGARAGRTERFTSHPPRVARARRIRRRLAPLQPDARCHRKPGRTRWRIPGYRSSLRALTRRPAAMAWAAPLRVHAGAARRAGYGRELSARRLEPSQARYESTSQPDV